MQRLEAASGVSLVQRTTRRLALTHVDAAVAELGDERADPVGTVRVVLPSSAVTTACGCACS
jgi:DNA-binding transcriptional LysR family regulator